MHTTAAKNQILNSRAKLMDIDSVKSTNHRQQTFTMQFEISFTSGKKLAEFSSVKEVLESFEPTKTKNATAAESMAKTEPAKKKAGWPKGKPRGPKKQKENTETQKMKRARDDLTSIADEPAKKKAGWPKGKPRGPKKQKENTETQKMKRARDDLTSIADEPAKKKAGWPKGKPRGPKKDSSKDDTLRTSTSMLHSLEYYFLKSNEEDDASPTMISLKGFPEEHIVLIQKFLRIQLEYSFHDVYLALGPGSISPELKILQNKLDEIFSKLLDANVFTSKHDCKIGDCRRTWSLVYGNEL